MQPRQQARCACAPLCASLSCSSSGKYGPERAADGQVTTFDASAWTAPIDDFFFTEFHYIRYEL